MHEHPVSKQKKSAFAALCSTCAPVCLFDFIAICF